MEIDFEADDWPDCPTTEQMQRQHIHLIEEENRLIQEELSRFRKHVVKLVDMHTEVSVERDNARRDLAQARAQLSDCLREKSALGNQVRGLEKCRDQLDEIHRTEAAVRARS